MPCFQTAHRQAGRGRYGGTTKSLFGNLMEPESGRFTHTLITWKLNERYVTIVTVSCLFSFVIPVILYIANRNIINILDHFLVISNYVNTI